MKAEQPPDRRLVLDWEDPGPTAALLRSLGGLGYLRGMAESRYPIFPAGALIGVRDLSFDHGVARVARAALDAAEIHMNPMNTMHGGILTTLLDCVMGPAVLSTLPTGRGHTTLTLEMKFTRAVTLASGRRMAEGRVVAGGRRVMTSEGRITDRDGRVCATGTSTVLVFDH